MRPFTTNNHCVHEAFNNSNDLHNPIPVVARGDPEEGEERHAKVVKGSVATETLARVLIRALWKRVKKKESPSEGCWNARGEDRRTGERGLCVCRLEQIKNKHSSCM